MPIIRQPLWCKKGIIYFLLLAFINSRAIVLYPDFYVIIESSIDLWMDKSRCWFSGKFQGIDAVSDQVYDDLFNLYMIDIDRRKIFLQFQC